MAFGGFDRNGGGNRPLGEINMIPLIDVMLVLLVIFMITAPLMEHGVKIDLPKASSQPNPAQPERIALSIAADGGLYWNGEAVERAVLRERLAAAAQRLPQPELHLRADKATPYQAVAEALADAANAGVSRIGFVSAPESPPNPQP